MITYKLKIKFCSNINLIKRDQKNYSFAYRKLYKNFELSEDENFIDWLKNKYHFDTWLIACLKVEVKNRLDRTKIFSEKKRKIIEEIKEELKILSKKNVLNKKQRRKKFKLRERLKYLNNSLEKDIVFGDKKILQRITFLSNDKVKNFELIKELKNKFNENRIIPFCIIGSAHQKGNNKFNFLLNRDKVIYKSGYRCCEKTDIEYYCSNKQRKTLHRLQYILDNKLTPCTVRVEEKYIHFSFDESVLNGYKLSVTDLHTAQKNKSSIERKEIFKSFHRELENKKLKNKISNRFCSIDMNPNYIGLSIFDKDENNKIKVIYTNCYNFVELNKKTGLIGSHELSKKKTRKRRFELYQVIRNIFKTCNYYKVAYFISEDLKFIPKINSEKKKKEFNRLKHIWNKKLLEKSIDKHCNLYGIQVIKVNACYSSFIGNIQHNYYDPIASSIEIGRRGALKYIKGNFFPQISQIDFDTMSKLIFGQLRDVQNKNGDWKVKFDECKSWRASFNLLKKTGTKYRHSLNQFDYKELSLFSHKSEVKTFKFMNRDNSIKNEYLAPTFQ